jgi:hypothetical protein
MNFLCMKNRYESQPVESNLNIQFAEEEVIPSPGHAKNLKDKFLNFEKEAQKVETSSSKMHYVPKKFTSVAQSKPSTATGPPSSSSSNPTVKPQQNNGNNKPAKQQAQATSQPAKSNGLLTTAPSNSTNALNTEKCCVCEKTVYAMEKIEADKKIYHKLCFKCTTCNCTLK